MKTEIKKYHLTALLWLMIGYLSWLAGLYSFTYLTSNLVQPISKFARNTFDSEYVLNLVTFTVFHLSDFIFIIVATFILTIITGKKAFWFLTFLAGAIAFPLYETFRGMMLYLDLYPELPSWAISWFIQALAAYMILTPIIAWTGVVLGHKYYESKQA